MKKREKGRRSEEVVVSSNSGVEEKGAVARARMMGIGSWTEYSYGVVGMQPSPYYGRNFGRGSPSRLQQLSGYRCVYY